MIRLYRIAPDVTVLGPGVRFGIWVQGCTRGCPGCMSPNTWDPKGGFIMDEDALVERMLVFGFEGITISGGEPMMQCAALCRVIGLLRTQRDIGVILYTGMTMEELRARRDPDTDALLSMTDLLIDGGYVAAQDDGGALRGSANQRAWFLTERYRRQISAVFGQKSLREQQIHIDEYGVLLIGLRKGGNA